MHMIFSWQASLRYMMDFRFLLVIAVPSACVSIATAQVATSHTSQVRPCTAEESAIGSSQEVLRKLDGERPWSKFNWCEAVDVPWLPDARILRFHTAYHVDYSLTCTFVKATSKSPIRLIAAAGEGFVQLPSPNLPEDLHAINELLRSSQPAFTNSQLGSAGILYLFLIGRENPGRDIRIRRFRKPSGEYPLPEDDYRVRYEEQGKNRIVTLISRSEQWKLTFSSQSDGLHLDSVSEIANKED
jgi:hypothetical protein